MGNTRVGFAVCLFCYLSRQQFRLFNKEPEMNTTHIPQKQLSLQTTEAPLAIVGAPIAATVAFTPALFNVKQVGAHLGGLHASRIYALMRDPSIGFPRQIKIGKTARWRKADIDAWIQAQAGAGETA